MLFLASPGSSFNTGTNLRVDGGLALTSWFNQTRLVKRMMMPVCGLGLGMCSGSFVVLYSSLLTPTHAQPHFFSYLQEYVGGTKDT